MRGPYSSLELGRVVQESTLVLTPKRRRMYRGLLPLHTQKNRRPTMQGRCKRTTAPHWQRSPKPLSKCAQQAHTKQLRGAAIDATSSVPTPKNQVAPVATIAAANLTSRRVDREGTLLVSPRPRFDLPRSPSLRRCAQQAHATRQGEQPKTPPASSQLPGARPRRRREEPRRTKSRRIKKGLFSMHASMIRPPEDP